MNHNDEESKRFCSDPECRNPRKPIDIRHDDEYCEECKWINRNSEDYSRCSGCKCKICYTCDNVFCEKCDLMLCKKCQKRKSVIIEDMECSNCNKS